MKTERVNYGDDMNKEQIQEQIAQCRKYADSQTMCGFDAGRSSSCYADWFWDEVADTLQSLLDRIEVLERVREAAIKIKDNVSEQPWDRYAVIPRGYIQDLKKALAAEDE